MNKYCQMIGLVFAVTNALGMQNIPTGSSGIYKGKAPLESNDYRQTSFAEFDHRFLRAVKENDIKVVKDFLMGAGAVRNIVLNSGNLEALKRNLSRRLWIREKTNINTQDADGNTPLIWAIRNGNYEMTDMLLQNKGIDLELKDNHGHTALDWAEVKGFVNILKWDDFKGFSNKIDFRKLDKKMDKHQTLLSHLYFPPNSAERFKIAFFPKKAFSIEGRLLMVKATLIKDYVNRGVYRKNREDKQRMLDEVGSLIDRRDNSQGADVEDIVWEWFKSVKPSLGSRKERFSGEITLSRENFSDNVFLNASELEQYRDRNRPNGGTISWGFAPKLKPASTISWGFAPTPKPEILSWEFAPNITSGGPKRESSAKVEDNQSVPEGESSASVDPRSVKYLSNYRIRF